MTDNVGATAKRASEDILGTSLNGSLFLKTISLEGKITKEDAEKIAGGLLANGLIERWEIISGKDQTKGKNVHLPLPVVRGKHTPSVAEIDLNVSDKKLKEMSTQKLLALNIAEMKAIQGYFNDERVTEEREDFGLTLTY